MSVQTREDIRVINCTECERPWGAVLPRSHDDTDVLRATLKLQDRFSDWWHELWLVDHDTLSECPPVVMPEPTLTSIVYVSDATLRWFEEDLQVHCAVVGDCWNEIEHADLPTWWVNRRRRFAMRWDCCGLGYPP